MSEKEQSQDRPQREDNRHDKDRSSYPNSRPDKSEESSWVNEGEQDYNRRPQTGMEIPTKPDSSENSKSSEDKSKND